MIVTLITWVMQMAQAACHVRLLCDIEFLLRRYASRYLGSLANTFYRPPSSKVTQTTYLPYVGRFLHKYLLPKVRCCGLTTWVVYYHFVAGPPVPFLYFTVQIG
ncbi:hypothetical protein F5X98DRAFT_353118 [Xylaria grammica]|nr:hypothetical protein F5X98DRAFT_353118 [Xylaria grammica]